MRKLYCGRSENRDIEQIAEISEILENASYVLTKGGESTLIDSAYLAKGGNKCQSRSRSTRSAGISSRLFKEK
jgi:hypothetical protein